MLSTIFPFTCTKKKTFRRAHVTHYHTGGSFGRTKNSRAQCPFCDRLFSSFATLNAHTIKQHGNVPVDVEGLRLVPMAAAPGDDAERSFPETPPAPRAEMGSGPSPAPQPDQEPVKSQQCSQCSMAFSHPFILRLHIRYAGLFGSF